MHPTKALAFCSDHSMTRCMVYGANAIPMGSICHSTADNPPNNLLLGMCFMAPVCNTSQHVTCHRYKPKYVANNHNVEAYTTSADMKSSIMFEAVPILRNRGYYRLYSSMFDGNKSDTYMR